MHNGDFIFPSFFYFLSLSISYILYLMPTSENMRNRCQKWLILWDLFLSGSMMKIEKKEKKKEMIGKKANQEGNDFHVAGWFWGKLPSRALPLFSKISLSFQCLPGFTSFLCLKDAACLSLSSLKYQDFSFFQGHF